MAVDKNQLKEMLRPLLKECLRDLLMEEKVPYVFSGSVEQGVWTSTNHQETDSMATIISIASG